MELVFEGDTFHWNAQGKKKSNLVGEKGLKIGGADLCRTIVMLFFWY